MPSISLFQAKIDVSEEVNGKLQPIGSVELGLFDSDLPLTTENFEWVCTEHLANSTFHRVIPGFMAQAGDFDRHDGTGGHAKNAGATKDEAFIYSHSAEVLSMANRGKQINHVYSVLHQARIPTVRNSLSRFKKRRGSMDAMLYLVASPRARKL